MRSAYLESDFDFCDECDDLTFSVENIGLQFDSLDIALERRLLFEEASHLTLIRETEADEPESTTNQPSDPNPSPS